MKILLRYHVDKLGKRGDVVDVKSGYARNFLFPQGFAMRADAGTLKRFEFERRRLEKEEQERLAGLRGVMNELAAFSLTVEMNANDEGHLFGSVGGQTIAKHLVEAGFDIQTRQVKLDTPIKELGIYQVPIAFEADERIEVKVWVVEAKDPDTEANAEEEGAKEAEAESSPE